MFFCKEDQELYLSNVQFNLALMLNELEKIVVNRGGKVEKQTAGYIVNRSIYDKYDEELKEIKTWKVAVDLFADDEEKKIRAERIVRKHEKKAQEYKQAIDNITPVHVNRISYIRFILDGYIYYFQFDSNPFFPFHFSKSAVNENGTYSKDVYMDDSKKEWLWDCFFNSVRMCDDDLKEAANLLLNELETACPSRKYRDGTKKRVPNTYNNGYHYETVYKPERIEKVDF